MLCDYHIHSTYCDGKNTLRENIESAIGKGMDIIGFSSHSHIKNTMYCMTPDSTQMYISDLKALREEYKDRITVMCGLEKDCLSDDDETLFEYVIGSVHSISAPDGKRYDVDLSMANTAEAISGSFGGDALSYCECYYSTIGDLFSRVKADIIGHFDLITKFCERGYAFDTSSMRYITACTNALDSLLAYGVPFEINSGAISRGYRTSPYPSCEILRYIHEKGGSIILSSDSHDARYLCHAFDLSAQIARSCGFKTQMILTPNGKNEIEL